MTSGAGKESDNRRSGGSQAGRFNCLVGQLGEPRLHGLVPGLCEKDGLFTIDRAVWVCCEGSGFREVFPERQGSPSTMVSCDLAHRLRLAQDIHAQYLKHYSESPFRLNVGPKPLAPYLERLCLIAKGATHLGLCIMPPRPSDVASSVKAGAASPVSLWQVALMAAWRFGLKGHVVDLAKTNANRLLPAAGKESPKILYIENVDRLWDPVAAERFELVVQYAYNAMIPLFISVNSLSQSPDIGASTPRASGPSSLKGAFSVRIARAKSNLAVSALSPDCTPKLRSTTTGIDMWLKSSVVERSKT
jgi:hypothetical protein